MLRQCQATMFLSFQLQHRDYTPATRSAMRRQLEERLVLSLSKLATKVSPVQVEATKFVAPLALILRSRCLRCTLTLARTRTLTHTHTRALA